MEVLSEIKYAQMDIFCGKYGEITGYIYLNTE
jgi:hypothetical protein